MVRKSFIPADWTAPRAAIRANGQPLEKIPRFATLQKIGNALLIAGNDLQRSKAPRFGTLTLLRGEEHFADIPAPSGKFQFIMPHAVMTGRTFHLIWGEYSGNLSSSETDWVTARVDEVWTARLTDEHKWSEPQLIYKGDLKWGKDKFGSFAVSGESLALAVATSGTNPAPDLILLQYVDNQWSIDSVHLEQSARPMFVSTTISKEGIAVGFIAGSFTVDRDRNSVWVIRHQGKTGWSRQELIHLSGSQPAMFVRPHISVDQRLTGMIWAQQTPNGVFLVHSARSPAGSWKETHKIAIEGGFLKPMAASSLGRTHIVFETGEMPESSSTIAHIEWSTEWGPQQSLLQGIRATDAAIVASELGEICVVALGRQFDAAPEARLQLMTTARNGPQKIVDR